MGTWRTFDTTEDRALLAETAISAGITLFDSSPMYGRAEGVLSAALRGSREQVQVATKVWTESPEEGRRQAENALRLYGRVDIYQVHNLVNWKAQLKLLEGLRDLCDPPAVLYYRGCLSSLSARTVAIVGSRAATP